MKRGTQIIYVPLHAEGDISHKDCEYGFITAVREDTVFCRFWYAPCNNPALRTHVNSESCGKHLLVVQDTVDQEHVEQALKEYC